MSVNKATVGAISFSGITLIACLYAIAVIYNDVQSIWAELDSEMDSFKVLADDLWGDMVKMGAGTPSNRIRRQAYGGYGASSGPGFPSNSPPIPGTSGIPPHLSGNPSNSRCNCQSTSESKCAPGPDGPVGEPGPNGLDGLPGLDGKDGQDA
uniref:Nematode cuticle collagen N-terminal domain-containing protein n=1 Tax=Panagrolaimus sp. ES5 TaxID=591445 RepID=A0AC34GGK9_9BILA